MADKMQQDIERKLIVREALRRVVNRDFREVREEIDRGDWDRTELFEAGMSVLDVLEEIKPILIRRVETAASKKTIR